ncbi:MAG: RNA methyltransferase [Clostridia bacterium]|nr:RNA methyltransferase [Clostridia bacterium]
MQKEYKKFESSSIFEGMTSIRSIIKGTEFGINNRKIEKILFDGSKLHKIGKDVGYLKAVSEKYGYKLEEKSASELEELALGNSHGGLLAIASERIIPRLDESASLLPGSFYVMLDGIEDPYNFGYCIRSLYAMGCDGIILSERNWMSAAGVVSRSSAGASEMLPMYVSAPLDAVRYFKQGGFEVVCADEKTDNVLGECELRLPLFLIIGGEKRGISKSVISECDTLVKIDYGRDFRASLSAASAATMFAYEIHRQNRHYSIKSH